MELDRILSLSAGSQVNSVAEDFGRCAAGFLILVCLFGMGRNVRAQGQAPTPPQPTVSGYVEDAATGERLKGATVSVPALGSGTATDRYGFFALSVSGQDSVRLIFSYVGYRPQTRRLSLHRDTSLTIRLVPDTTGLGILTVRGRQAGPARRTGRLKLMPRTVKAIPSLSGEADVIKALQLMPGVSGGQEGSARLHVRGGDPSQNLILLDGVPIYNASHLFGFLSIFNTDAIESVELTKGGFPARYGGRLSSVVDVRLREGNRNEYAGRGAVSLLASQFTMEGPIRQGRSSFLVSARRTYFDQLVRPFMAEDALPVAYFWDVNAKLSHIFSPEDRVYLSVYAGKDRFGADNSEDESRSSNRLGWGNVTAALRWSRHVSDRLFGNATLTFSRYQFGIEAERTESIDGGKETFSLDYQSFIRDAALDIDVDFSPRPGHRMRFGGKVTWHVFAPGALSTQTNGPNALESSGDTTIATTRRGAVEGVAYVEDEMQLSPRLQANVGLHASAYGVDDQVYGSLQPRLSARYALSETWSVKGSFATMRQYLHLLSSSSVGVPTALWVSSTERVPPQDAWQGTLGLAGSLLGEGTYEVRLEGYYKRLSNLVTYRPGTLFARPGADWQDYVATEGHGTSYGAELFLRKKRGRLTGWIGYTLSRSDRQFDALNEGEPFPYHYDRRHDLEVTMSYKISESDEVSATWVYRTGSALTLPRARYQRTGGAFNQELIRYKEDLFYYGERNSFRMPAYHRLDISLRKYLSRDPLRTLSFNIYNLYSRKNPFYLDYQTECAGEDPCEEVLTGYAFLPVLPSVSYRFAF